MSESPKAQLETREIEANKDQYDLRPCLEFIENHLPEYRHALSDFLKRPASPYFTEWQKEIDIAGITYDDTLQLPPARAFEVLSHLPEGMLKASGLKTIDYAKQAIVPVPQFDADGKWTYKVDEVHTSQMGTGSIHPSRMLIGQTTKQGTSITETAIPKTVSNNPEAIELYQIHVLLHEFFHTIEIPFRNKSDAESPLLMPQGKTFAEWIRDFKNSMIEEPAFTSSYAATYKDSLLAGNYYALAEQMAESFVAYLLDIVPSPDGYTSFKQFDCGGTNFTKTGSSKRFLLMKEL